MSKVTDDHGESTARLIPKSANQERPLFAWLKTDWKSNFIRQTEALMESHYDAMMKAAKKLEDRGKVQEAKNLREAAKSVALPQHSTFFPQVTTDPYTSAVKYMMLDSILNDGNCIRPVKTLITFTLGQKTTPKLISRLAPDGQIHPNGSTTFNGVTINNQDILKICQLIENKREVNFRERLQGLMKQAYAYGRGALGIVYGDFEYNGQKFENMPIALRPLTSIFLGYVTINANTWMPENVIYATLTASMSNPVPMTELVYLVHEDDNTQPRSVGYGCSLLLSAIHLSESVRYAQEVSIKEIFHSLWAGMLEIKANTRVQARLDALSAAFQQGAGTSYVHNQDITVNEHKIEHDLDKLMAAMDMIADMIARSVGVPSPLINHEAVTNRATLDLVVQAWEASRLRNERNWVNDCISFQWYDPILMSIFNVPPDQREMMASCPVKVIMDFTSITFATIEDKVPLIAPLKQSGLFTDERIIKMLDLPQEALAELEEARQQNLQKQQQQMSMNPAVQSAINQSKTTDRLNAFLDEQEKNKPKVNRPQDGGDKGSL